MMRWPTKPFIYQINTWVWLNALSQQHGRTITLSDVPDDVLDELAALNVDAIWLMGVWQRSEAVRASALNYTHEYRPVLTDLTEDDVIGSAYAIGAYEVDERIGGREGLAALRERLRARGLLLILDYVPNHVAVDHPWVTDQPEYLVRGTAESYQENEGMFFAVGNGHGDENGNGENGAYYVAHGRDPYFPGWIDTAQVNAYSPIYRAAARETLLNIADQCDGVRCDMAMLVTNDIFGMTWGAFLEEAAPEIEFWEEIIPAVRADYPDFQFIAEVYWDMEHILQQQGFDFTYDKLMYDRLVEGDALRIRQHLEGDAAYQARTVHFIENHDEPRAADQFGVEKSRAAAVLICTTPGAVLLHDGQFVARKIKLPVQIGRGPDEPHNRALKTFYDRLLYEVRDPIYTGGEWRLLETSSPYADHDTSHNLLAYCWRAEDAFRLIVVNITPQWSGAVIRLDWPELAGEHWRLADLLSGNCRYAKGDDLAEAGLTLELEPFQSTIWHFQPISPEQYAEINELAGAFGS